jgi:hypothetical protein
MKSLLRLADTIIARLFPYREPSVYHRCLAVHLHHAGACRTFSA